MVVLSLKLLASFALCMCTAASTTLSLTPLVNLGYTTCQGILVQDPQNNETNINFLGVRYAASPTGAAIATYCSTAFQPL